MANKEIKIWESIENIGYHPKKNHSIIVSYAPENLSDKIAKFFISNQFYVLQMCETEIVLIPFSQILLELKKEVALEISFESIKSVEITEKGLNYYISIETEEDRIVLVTEQKELSDWRMAGLITNSILFGKNWHKENLDETLKSLAKLG